jgi:hypothetical protein
VVEIVPLVKRERVDYSKIELQELQVVGEVACFAGHKGG